MDKKVNWVLAEAAIICSNIIEHSHPKEGIAVIHLEHTDYIKKETSTKYTYTQRSVIEFLVSKKIIKEINRPQFTDRNVDTFLYKVSFRVGTAKAFLKNNRNKTAYAVSLIDDNVYINDMKLSQMYAGRDMEVIFKYIFSHPNLILSRKVIEDATGVIIKSSLVDKMRDLGFKGKLKKVFFPILSEDRVHFINKVSVSDSIQRHLSLVSFKPFQKI